MPSVTRPAAAEARTFTRVHRTVAAVTVGYLIFALSAVALFRLSGRDPHASQPLGLVIVSVIYGMVFAALGGVIAARLAPSRSLLHAGSVAVLLALGAGVSLVASPAADATWSQWAALALMAPSAWVGGYIATRRPRVAQSAG